MRNYLQKIITRGNSAMSERQESSSTTILGEHAVVIGGSIAGCLTARVLSDYFDKVTIFEADTPPDEAVPRKGVPQGNHIHTLLSGALPFYVNFSPRFMTILSPLVLNAAIRKLNGVRIWEVHGLNEYPVV